LSLNVKVLNSEGEEIQLSTLCNEEEPSVYVNRAEEAAIEEALNGHRDDDSEIGKSFLISDENGEYIEDDEEFEFDDEDSYDEDYED
jgi:hypothetical protein